MSGDVLGRVEDLARIARAEFVDEIILAIPDQHDLARRVVREARRNRLNIRVIPDLYDCGWDGEQGHACEPAGAGIFRRPASDHPARGKSPGGRPPVETRARFVHLLPWLWCMLAPLMAVIALVIKLTSPGQVLYQAQRVGLKGRRFVCYKFRTMVADADRLKDGLR